MKYVSRNYQFESCKDKIINCIEDIHDYYINHNYNKTELVNYLEEKYPTPEEYKNIFTQDFELQQLINAYKKEGIYDYVKTQPDFIKHCLLNDIEISNINNSMDIHYIIKTISSSNNPSIQKAYKKFCDKLELDYEPLVPFPNKYQCITNIYEEKQGHLYDILYKIKKKIFNKTLNKTAIINLNNYNKEQQQTIIEINDLNQNCPPENRIDMNKILNPGFSPYLIQQIEILERYKPNSSLPIRNIKLINPEQIDKLVDLIKQDIDVMFIRYSSFNWEKYEQSYNTYNNMNLINVKNNKEQNKSIDNSIKDNAIDKQYIIDDYER